MGGMQYPWPAGMNPQFIHHNSSIGPTADDDGDDDDVRGESHDDLGSDIFPRGPLEVLQQWGAEGKNNRGKK